jgi:hypothetical protein
MQNRTPVARTARPALPTFTPVPRKYRHDGWTPERQRAFIEALADTGSVTRAAGMVNMAQTNCYTLRRAPGAEEFRRAWDAALDFGVQRLKDIAFERAIDGQLVPVFVAGKLLGFRRVRNDALLMFCLRHYGQDAGGRRTTIDYFSTRASAGAAADGDGAEAGAQASTTTVRTVINGNAGDAGEKAGRVDALAGELARFEGVALDAEAEAAIAAAVAACALRRREADAAMAAGGSVAGDAAESDPDEPFVAGTLGDFRGELEPAGLCEDFVPFGADEVPWALAGVEAPVDGVAAVRRTARRRKRVG